MKFNYRIFIIVILAIIPYGFLAMYWDYVDRSTDGYVIWIFASLVIGFLAKRWFSWMVVFLVPLPSVLLSYLLIIFISEPHWGLFFKPFGTFGTLILFSVLHIIPLAIGGFVSKVIKK